MEITDNIPGHRDRQRERETETRIEKRTYTRTISYNIAEQSDKLPVIYSDTDTNREKCTRTPRQTERKTETYPDTGADIQRQRESERQKYESRDVRIHTVLIIIVIHTYIF